MESENNNALLDYSKKLEFLLIQSVKNSLKYKRNVKSKLKSLCMTLIEKGIKPEEIVKSINLRSNSSKNQLQYDFSEDSDEETDGEKKKISESGKDKAKVGSDTESDSEMENVNRQKEEEILGGGSTLETLLKVKKFIEKNHYTLGMRSKYPNGIIDINTDHNLNKNSKHEYLNKKRKGPDHSD